MSDGFRLALTGATGDFGKSILAWALADERVTEVTALGRRRTSRTHPKLREAPLDLNGEIDLEPVAGYDALIHVAYCVEEPRDKRYGYRVNVTATKAIIEQAREAKIGQLVLTSSANALGAQACGTGVLYPEEQFPAGDQGHYYFHHKALLEHLAHWYWANASPSDTVLAVVRPCYIVGEHFDNSGLRTMLRKLVVFPEPERSRYQFLWDEDLVRAYTTILFQQLSGLYNVAPEDATSVAEICALTKARLVSAPARVLAPLSDALFALRLQPFSGHWVTLGDPLIDSTKLRAQTSWKPSADSTTALRRYLESRRQP